MKIGRGAESEQCFLSSLVPLILVPSSRAVVPSHFTLQTPGSIRTAFLLFGPWPAGKIWALTQVSVF
jgi:hypothetical protein